MPLPLTCRCPGRTARPRSLKPRSPHRGRWDLPRDQGLARCWQASLGRQRGLSPGGDGASVRLLPHRTLVGFVSPSFLSSTQAAPCPCTQPRTARRTEALCVQPLAPRAGSWQRFPQAGWGQGGGPCSCPAVHPTQPPPWGAGQWPQKHSRSCQVGTVLTVSPNPGLGGGRGHLRAETLLDPPRPQRSPHLGACQQHHQEGSQ